MPLSGSGTRPKWHALGALLLVVGVLTSTVAAQAVATARSNAERAAFRSDASQVVADVQLQLQRGRDLIIAAAVEMAHEWQTAPTAFPAWARDIQLLARYPEVQDIGAVVMATPAELPAFAERGGRAFILDPAGRRPFYCLGLAGISRSTVTVTPPGLDLCQTPMRSGLLTARDSGTGSTTELRLPGKTWLGVQTPFYRGGSVPTSPGGRRAAFLGWLGTTLDPTAVLDEARNSRPKLSLRLTFEEGPERATFASGRAHPGGLVFTEQLGHGWSAEVTGPTAATGVVGNSGARSVLLGGSVISLLLATLVLALATGRGRALRLVEQKTNELRLQALHDAFTGLPNRNLLMDRLRHALSRGRRQDTSPAVMFLDLDGFKEVNDTYGHAAGDELLRVVSRRIHSELRESDTLARIGGDEFVILVDDSTPTGGPREIAERVLGALAVPCVLETAGNAIVAIGASIGIALGPAPTAEDLLHDADVALYAAKAAGKNRVVVFAPEQQPTSTRQ